jgi:hypothetical protein
MNADEDTGGFLPGVSLYFAYFFGCDQAAFLKIAAFAACFGVR